MTKSLRLFKTTALQPSQVTRQSYLVDARSQTLGRLAAEIAKLLIGKQKPNYSPHVDGGDRVIVVNSDSLKTTGDKLANKQYYRHSGYIGNLKTISLKRQLEKDSTKVIRWAVSGMLPKNKLRAKRLQRLLVYRGAAPTEIAPEASIEAGFVKIK